MSEEEVMRTLLAGIALHGMIGTGRYSPEQAVEGAVEIVDMLLDELEADDKPTEPKQGIIAITPKRRKYK
jgi:hypothetical protein